MIMAWLTYCVLVSGLLAGAAWVAERAMRAQGWPGRWPWAVALAGSIGLPLGAWLRPAPAPEVASSSGLPFPGVYVMESIPMLTFQPAAAAGPPWETVLLLAWAAASGALLLYLAWSGLRVRAEGRRWSRREVEGVEVLVSESTGPAALGLFRGRVVLPEWALAMDERLRRLLVLHEAEHVRAKDPQLAVAGLVTCALMPWNPVLWWQLARLRLAIEMDCDERVLRRSNDTAGYGSLLLEVGQRRARLAVGLAESRTMLERRIRMITRTRTGRRTLQALALAGVAGVAVVVACETPPPTGIADQPSQPLTEERALSEAQALACEPLVFIDGSLSNRGRLNELRPNDVQHIDVLRGQFSLRTDELRLEGEAAPPGHLPRFDADCGVILIQTTDASPEAIESLRRLRETFREQRAGERAEAVAQERAQEADGPTFTPMTVRPQLQNPEEVRDAVDRNYPPLLRDAGISGVANVWLYIDEEGRVQRVQINRSSGYDALDQGALRAAAVMRFTPAYNRDVRVPVWVALDIQFLTGEPARDAEAMAAARRAQEAARAEMAERTRQAQQELARQRMEEPRGEPAVDRDIAAAPTFTPMTARPQLRNAQEVRQALQRHYPPLLRQAGIGGTANVWFFIDETGVVRDVRINRSSGHEALDEAALRVGRTMEFTPARNRDEPVPVWVALDITFEIQ
jgi:TonB family protein